MDNNDIVELKNLNDSELLSLYDMVLDHLEYLKNNLINDSIDGGESDNG